MVAERTAVGMMWTSRCWIYLTGSLRTVGSGAGLPGTNPAHRAAITSQGVLVIGVLIRNNNLAQTSRFGA